MYYYIGIDIGGTKCAVTLGEWENQEIKIRSRHEVSTKSTPTDMMTICV